MKPQPPDRIPPLRLSARDNPSLDDPEHVEGEIKMFLLDVIAHAEADNTTGVIACARDMALLFSGTTGLATPKPDWHSPETMGLYIGRYWKIDPRQPLRDLLETLFLMAVSRIYDTVAMIDENIEKSTFERDILIEELVALLTGTWEIVYPPDEYQPWWCWTCPSVPLPDWWAEIPPPPRCALLSDQ